MRRRLPESAARRKLAWLMTERRRAGLWLRWVEQSPDANGYEVN